jgi:hypothetical protein
MRNPVYYLDSKSVLHPYFPATFHVGDIYIASMSSFFQGLAVPNDKFQRLVLSTSGELFYKCCSQYKIPIEPEPHRIAWWQGEAMERDGRAFRELILDTFDSLSTSARIESAVQQLIRQGITRGLTFEPATFGAHGPYIDCQGYNAHLNNLLRQQLVANSIKAAASQPQKSRAEKARSFS